MTHHDYDADRTIADEMLDKQKTDREDAAAREGLGRLVREIWIDWATEQPNPKPSWLAPWEQLTEPEKEVDRRIGEKIFKLGIKTAREISSPSYGRALYDRLTSMRALARRSARTLSQIVDLANINPATREILRDIGNRLYSAGELAPPHFESPIPPPTSAAAISPPPQAVTDSPGSQSA